MGFLPETHGVSRLAGISPGDWLAGDLSGPEGTPLGLAKVHVRTGRMIRLTDFGSRAAWLQDGRRQLFAASRRTFLLDTETGEARLILDRSPNLVAYPRLRGDDREIGVVLVSTQADIWRLATR